MKTLLYGIGALVAIVIAFKVIKFAIGWLFILALIAGVGLAARYALTRGK